MRGMGRRSAALAAAGLFQRNQRRRRWRRRWRRRRRWPRSSHNRKDMLSNHTATAKPISTMPTKPIVSHIGAAAPSCTRAGPSHNPTSAAAGPTRSNAPAGPRKTLRLPRSVAEAAANRNQLRQPMRGGGAGGILTRRWGGGAGGSGPVRHHCNTMLGCGRQRHAGFGRIRAGGGAGGRCKPAADQGSQAGRGGRGGRGGRALTLAAARTPQDAGPSGPTAREVGREQTKAAKPSSAGGRAGGRSGAEPGGRGESGAAGSRRLLQGGGPASGEARGRAQGIVWLL